MNSSSDTPAQAAGRPLLSIEGLTVVEARANGHVPVSAGGINGASSLVDFATARGGAIVARCPVLLVK